MAMTPVADTGIGYVQITIHLVNGKKHRFVQTDSREAHTLLEQLRPERIFSQKQIIIAGTEAATVISTENVERVDVHSDPTPVWEHRETVESIHEVALEEFVRLRRPDVTPHPAPTLPPRPAGNVGMLVELHSGASVPLRLRLRPSTRSTEGGDSAPLTPADGQAFMQHLFSRHVLFGEMEDQGIFLLNPANALRFLLSPPPPVQSLPSVWTMEIDPSF